MVLIPVYIYIRLIRYCFGFRTQDMLLPEGHSLPYHASLTALTSRAFDSTELSKIDAAHFWSSKAGPHAFEQKKRHKFRSE